MSINNNGLTKNTLPEKIGPAQGVLDIGVEITRDVNGIEMGVLDNGTPFLSQRGLAVLCGIENAHIGFLSKEWEMERNGDISKKKRLHFIKSHLDSQGYAENKLYIETKKDGRIIYAYPDVVCMAILEYYAFEAADVKEDALNNYRLLARYSFREFIYRAVGYNPEQKQLTSWRYYHDRVSLVKNAVPDNYFSVFNEIAGLFVDMIESGLTISDNVIPDISVGQIWSRYWTDQNLSAKYGERIKYDHDYPEYYPQSKSNPQPSWAYPVVVLPIFREWFKNNYLALKFPKYILDKTKLITSEKEKAMKLIENLNPTKMIA